MSAEETSRRAAPVVVRIDSRTRHDLRTPLNQIIGYSELLAEAAEDEGRTSERQDLERVSTAARTLLGQLDALFSRPQDGSAAPDTSPRESRSSVRWSTGQIPPVSADGGPETDGGAARILVVDDVELNRDMLCRRLRRQGYEVETAEDGAAALKLIANRPYDLVLLDVMMPEMDGREVLKRLKADPTMHNLPVVMISALTELDSIVQCVELGAEDYLPKPFEPVLLRARVGASIEKKRLRDQERAHLRRLERANRELRETQAQLIEAEKMASLGMLVSGIAHELNSPVGAASSMVETMRGAMTRLRRVLQEEGVEEAAGIARLLKVLADGVGVVADGLRRSSDIVARLRSFAHLDEAEFKETDVHEGIRNTLAQLKYQLRRIDVECRLGDVPPLTCYPQRLNQLFLSVLLNACQAMPDGGAITVETREVDGRVLVSIADTGSGIAEADLTRIFDPGFTTKGVGVGTGLGLAISYQIIREHRGEIEVESELGRGSTFNIWVPTDLRQRLASSSS